MLKLGFAMATLALGLVLPAAYAVSGKPRPRTIESTLLDRMNSGGDGSITRRVECAPTVKPRLSFACTLTSVRSTTLDVRVDVTGDGLRTVWYPLEG